jgi:hypothetical protein
MVCTLFFLPYSGSRLYCCQGTPPFMAIKIMLKDGKCFCHQLRHDLELIFHVLLWLCCHMVEAGVERPLDQPPHMREWCNMLLNLWALGHHKLAHITNAERTLLADFTPYWDDFKLFVRRFLTAFWPHNPAYPNKITPKGMLVILKEAQVTV